MTEWKSAGRMLGIVAIGAVAGAAAMWAGPTTRTVDCSRKSLQEAIDGADDGDTIEVDGVCVGNFRIVDKRLTLRAVGAGGTHRLSGAPGAGDAPVLAISHSAGVTVEDLWIVEGEGVGLAVVASTVTLEDVRISYHDGDGLRADGASLIDGLRVGMFANGASGMRADAGSRIVCDECDISNSDYAVDARDGARIVLHDSSVIADRALHAEGGSATLDCVELVSPHACFLNGHFSAASADFGGVVSLRGIGDFHGQVSAFDRGEVQLLGARQLDAGVSGFGLIDLDSRLLVMDLEDEDEVQQASRISETVLVTRFSRAVLDQQSTLDGALHCSDAGDAWAGDEVVFTAGAAITGCANAVHP